jgi:hypothetical protein
MAKLDRRRRTAPSDAYDLLSPNPISANCRAKVAVVMTDSMSWLPGGASTGATGALAHRWPEGPKALPAIRCNLDRPIRLCENMRMNS